MKDPELGKSVLGGQTDAAKPQSQFFSKMFLVNVALDFGLIIALPLTVGVWLGRKVDGHYGTKYFVIGGILLALALSTFGIYRQIVKLSKLVKK